MRLTMRTVLMSGAAWVFGAVTSVGIGVVALSMIGGGFGYDGVAPLNAGGPTAPVVASEPPVMLSTPASGTPAGPGSPRPTSTTSADRVLRSDGGFVVARCIDERAYLVSWTPEQGYEASDPHRGPAATASIEFEGARRHIHLVVSCNAGVPQAHVEDEPEDVASDP